MMNMITLNGRGSADFLASKGRWRVHGFWTLLQTSLSRSQISFIGITDHINGINHSWQTLLQMLTLLLKKFEFGQWEKLISLFYLFTYNKSAHNLKKNFNLFFVKTNKQYQNFSLLIIQFKIDFHCFTSLPPINRRTGIHLKRYFRIWYFTKVWSRFLDDDEH